MPPVDALPQPTDDWAMFLDVDGTLIEIAPTPCAARAGPATGDMLTRLSKRLDGAVALVSGRTIGVIDRLFPQRFCCAGLHGLERRGPDGLVTRAPALGDTLDAVRREVAVFVAANPGVLVEDKGLTLGLHYRARPKLEKKVRAFADGLVRRLNHGMVLQTGKMLVEFRPQGPDKGDAVDAFMAVAPFAGRLPVFIGDDVTDEAGFRAVNARDGLSVRIGGCNGSLARYGISDVATLLSWLHKAAGDSA